MVLFLSWTRPSPQQQKACIDSGVFNYDSKYHGASSSSSHSQGGGVEAAAGAEADGFHVNQIRVLLGSGPHTFHRAKAALRSWRHFGLGWAFVEPETPVEKGTKFCVCVKELLPWIMMPLQIAYVTDTSSSSINCTGVGGGGGGGGGQHPSDHIKASFGFGSGTLHGHLLAGEERFSIQWEENDQVYYEIFSFSKPAHILSIIGYPYVQLRQKYFAQQSTRAILKHVTSQQSSMF